MQNMQEDMEEDGLIGSFEDVIPVPAGPPPVKRGREPVWVKKLRPLVEHPGQWFIVKAGPGSHSTANNLRRRQVNIPHPDHEWEFVARSEEGVAKVYARYLGERHT